MNPILEGLNQKQVEAVTAGNGPVLVISGPGAGKTRALTHRIAWLINSGTHAERILAVTFTNKAANEIKQRVAALLAQRSVAPIVGTFHAIGLRILRRDGELIGYRNGFAILDYADQSSIVKRIAISLGLDPKRYAAAGLLSRIQKLKTELVGPESFTPSGPYEQALARVYRAYQAELMRMNATDFGDLVMQPIVLFRNHPDILHKYRSWWHHILVDEYQDTSHDQYTLITMLVGEHRNLFCIGDDAQSIYRFRQADIRNILHFQRDYPDATVVMLEQNYRSTKTILAAAQAVISNNKNQIPKELWTDNGAGDAISVIEAPSGRSEAQYITDTALQLTKQPASPKTRLADLAKQVSIRGGRYALSDIAILYRTHAQSRALEEAFVQSGVPYRIVGGIRFYERREIKDLLAYLRVTANPSDLVSFERIANVPTRGIGPATVDRIVSEGRDDLATAVARSANNHTPTSRTGKALTRFAALLAELRTAAATKTPAALIRDIIKHTRYDEHLRTIEERGNAAQTAEERMENVKELLTVAKKFDEAGPEGLARFLEEVALVQDVEPTADMAQGVTLMTMHAAKGLEFPVVFVAGMEEGLFPHSRTIFDPHELEEERRLCYVALTRAKEKLFVTLARWRTIYGTRQANIPSRFLTEMPADLLAWRTLEWDSERSADETVTYDE